MAAQGGERHRALHGQHGGREPRLFPCSRPFRTTPSSAIAVPPRSSRSVDWLCWPHFDSPAIFGALLDSERGGAFAIDPTRPAQMERRYRPETNVLETTFRGAAGTVLLTDLMPVWGAGGGDRLRPEHEMLRVVECLGGEMELQARYDPRPEFGRGCPAHRFRGALGHRLRAGKGLLVLRTGVDFGPDPRGGLAALWRMRAPFA